MTKTKKKLHHNTGIMNKMRDKMPLIIIILIIAFLGTIVFEWGMNYMGLQDENYVFGEVNGEEISYQEFELQVQQQIDQMRQNNPEQEIDDAAVQQVRTQTWNSIVQNILLNQEIERLGITVNDDEILDWIYKKPETLPQSIKQFFMDSTGVFDYNGYQGALNNKDPQVIAFWKQVENELRRTLLLKKLQNVITSSILVTEEDVLRAYKDQNIMASFDYLLMPLTGANDPAFHNPSEEELRKYYEEHKDEFKQEEAVRFKYVLVNDAANAQDSTDTENMLKALIETFKEYDPADSSFIEFVNANSTTKFNGEFSKPNAIAQGTLDYLFTAQPGEVSEVIKDDDGFKIVRMIESKEGDETFVKASHILVEFGADTNAAKQKAEEILEKVNSGEDFKTLAMQLSTDPTAKQNGGSLGWFTKGAMVKEFEEAAFNNPVGSVVGPIKTQFGFHIVKVEGKDNKEFKYAEIKQAVVPGPRTKELSKKLAEDIYNEINDGGIIDSVAASYNLIVSPSGEIVRDGIIPIAGQNSSLVKFGFDSEINSVHLPVKVQGGYAVFQVTEKLEEGYQNYDSIKAVQIMPKVIMEKQFAYLKQQADNMQSSVQGGDFKALSEGNPDLQYGAVDSMLAASPNPAIGADYAFFNALYSMKNGEISGPIKGAKGYYFIKMRDITPFNEQDYLAKASELRTNLLRQKEQEVIQSWIENLKKNAKMQDNRDLFYS